MMIRGIGFFLLIILLSPSIVRAGAWVQQKNGLYLKISANYLFTTREFNHLGEELAIFQERLAFINTSFRDFSMNAYVEYGLLERLTVVAHLPYKILTAKRTETIGGDIVARILTLHTLGFGDLTVLGRYAVQTAPLALSVQGGVKIPPGYEKNPANEGAPLGSGEWDAEAHLLVGKSLYPLPLYLTGGLGYRQRGGPLSDQFLYNAEAGLTWRNVLLKVTLDGLFSTVKPPDLAGQPIVTPIPGGGGVLPTVIVGDQDIHKISPSLIVKISPVTSLQAEVLHIFAGKNTVAGTIFSFGVVITKK